VIADATWDAGNLGCGDLLLQLRFRIETLEPGRVLRLVALDPGAPADLPAWCRLTGHALVAAEHPVYFIRRKER
jgi:tRNA 2-thiouridine synthesizing protein A